jgi:uncharacterized protein (TIGR01777 family)
MVITLFGASGFIGKQLVNFLLEKNYTINIITRIKEKGRNLFSDQIKIYDNNFDSLLELINRTDVIINLTGENISGGLWTKTRKQKILISRIKTGELITSLCEKAENKPTLVIQSSAIGFYGFISERLCTEKTKKGEGFLADVCEKWENSIQSISKLGIKRTIIRTGIVLGKSGGILPKLLLSFRFCIGIILGKGNNYISWIHIADEIRAIEFIIRNPDKSDIYNLTAPTAATMKEIISTISKKKRPLFLLSIPDKIINFFLGDMGKEMLLANQKVSPTNLSSNGFKFEFETIESSLNNLLT